MGLFGKKKAFTQSSHDDWHNQWQSAFPPECRDVPVTHDGKTFVAQRSHIDLNGHVNNVRYVEWMLESAPGAAARRPRDVEFAFRSETLAGETVVSRCAPAPGGGLAYCVSSPAGVAHLLAIARA